MSRKAKTPGPVRVKALGANWMLYRGVKTRPEWIAEVATRADASLLRMSWEMRETLREIAIALSRLARPRGGNVDPTSRAELHRLSRKAASAISKAGG